MATLIRVKETCTYCNGKGIIGDMRACECFACGGKGFVKSWLDKDEFIHEIILKSKAKKR